MTEQGTAINFEVRGTTEGGYIADLVPAVAESMSWGALVSRQAVEDEIDMVLRTIRGFWDMEPDQVMQTLSALTARLTEMAIHLQRLEGRREWRQVRTMQVERTLLECDRQWKTASRMLEVRRQDLEQTR